MRRKENVFDAVCEIVLLTKNGRVTCVCLVSGSSKLYVLLFFYMDKTERFGFMFGEETNHFQFGHFLPGLYLHLF